VFGAMIRTVSMGMTAGPQSAVAALERKITDFAAGALVESLRAI